MMAELHYTRQRQQGGVIPYLIIMLILLSTMAGLASYSTQSVRLSSPRTDMITAFQYAQSGACLAGADLQNAVTNSGGSDFFATRQNNPAGPCTFMSVLSGSRPYMLRSTANTTVR